MTELPASDTLSAMAEVSVAFMGFTGVVGVFASRDRDLPAVSLRLWVMVGLAFATLLLSFFPSVLHHLGMHGPRLWATSSAAIVALCLGHIFFVLPRVFRERRAGRWSQPLIFELFPVVLVACLVSQGLNALGIGFDQTPGAFVLGLYLLLAGSGLNFIALLFALQSVGSNDA